MCSSSLIVITSEYYVPFYMDKQSKNPANQSKQQDSTELIQEVFQLFQISLAIGKSLDPIENAESFLKTLMSIKSLSYGGLWVNTDLFFEGEQLDGDFKLLKGFPDFIVEEKLCDLDSEFYKQLEERSYVIMDYDEGNKALFEQRKQEKGQLALIKLPKVGWLEFHSNQENLREVSVKKLVPVFQKFAQSITASLANERTIKTQQLLQETEKARRKAQDELIKQLQKNEQLQLKVTKELEQKVHERTQEIVAQNEELLQQQEEILTINEALAAQKEKLAFKNMATLQSIKYARTIQQAVFPSRNQFQKVFQNHFIIYKPKDVVSGDLYFVFENEQVKILIVADCTGHGVPGAFMSLLGVNILSDAVNNKKLVSPVDILSFLQKQIRKRLRQAESGNDDGMDLGVCMIEKQEGNQFKLNYAGSKNKLYLVAKEGGELQVFKSQRYKIGGKVVVNEASKKFTNMTVDMEAGGMFYMATDGFKDQPDKARKKFGSLRLQRLLTSICHLPLIEQKIALRKTLAEHMKDAEQRDDITLIAVQL